MEKKERENKKPIKIIFDTDIGGDCDDAGALALIHRLCDKGEAELLAVRTRVSPTRVPTAEFLPNARRALA